MPQVKQINWPTNKRPKPKPVNNHGLVRTPTHIGSTAKAWGLSEGEVAGIFGWIEDKVFPEYRSHVLTKLLRKHNKEANKPMSEHTSSISL